jgi:DtxR family transcriptional regulator, Mn-dependent transcriptional regulator
MEYASLISLAILLGLAILAYWLFRGEHGAFVRWRRSRQLSERVLREDALKHLHRCERYGRPASVESLAGAIQISVDETVALLTQLQERELVEIDNDGFVLTAKGHEYALHIIRAHRLWERYLADETGIASEAWHDQADWAEHSLSPAMVDALAEELGNPTHDPHGDPIPNASGEMVPHGGVPLTAATTDSLVRIVHLEDEPEAVYAQLVAEGLGPGMEARVLEKAPDRLIFWANGDEHVLAPIVAANISVVPLLRNNNEPTELGVALSELKPGEKGEVIGISRASRGTERRRFLDLGVIPGTIVEAELVGPGGDPTGYRIRDTLIAFRREQAEMIRIKRVSREEEPDAAIVEAEALQ